jgi:hypothetical protein
MNEKQKRLLFLCAHRSVRVTSQPWGMKEFFLCDPFRNLLLFGESIPEEDGSTRQGA